jgi:hypothetical protein
MEDTEKYLIHAAITADGVVERSDVVGAIFGQTEGLLGDDLDLRDLQQSSKVGRIDVEIDSQNGQSFGTVTIASTLDRVKTAILAASLETITRVGPCRATVEVTDIEDVREAKRREVVERAKELLSESFDESVMSSTEILDEVKESVRIEDISEYEGLPAGPRVGESDAIVVVEGRADVLRLLRYGIKNAIAVEGTNVPSAVADLTQDRTTTAFLDGDRGGKLILRELAQVADVDHVAFAPEGRSVEDLERHEVFSALRGKDPIGAVSVDATQPSDADGGTDGEPPDPRTGSPTPDPATPNTLDGQEYEYDARDGARPTRVRAPDAGDSDPHAAGADADEDRDDAEGGPADAGTRDAAASDEDDPGAAVADAALTRTGDAGGAPDADANSGVADVGAPDGDAADVGAASGTAADGTATDGSVPDGSIPAATDSRDDDAAGTDPDEGADPDADSGAESDTDGDTGPDTGEGADSAADHEERGDEDADSTGEPDAAGEDDPKPLPEHVREVVDGGTGTVRLLDDALVVIAEAPAADAFDAIGDADPAPHAVVLDGELTQRLLDVAAQRGVDQVVAATTGEFVKKPTAVRVRTADQLANSVTN